MLAERHVARLRLVEADDFELPAGLDPKFVQDWQRAKAVNAATKVEQDLWNLTSKELVGYRGVLEQARLQTINAMTSATKEWVVSDRQAVLNALDQALVQVDGYLNKSLTTTQSSAWEAGLALPDTMTAAIGVPSPAFPSIDPNLFSIAMQTTPELITNVTSQVRNSVASILRQGALGQVSPFEMMKQMGTVAGKGPWATAFNRGEAIYRTETGRMLQQAGHVRTTQLDAEYPGEWMKEWHARRDTRTRPTHVNADGQRRKPNEPFDIGDFKLMYPHDPRGPARETVFCRCMSLPVRPEWDTLRPGEEQGEVDPAEMARREAQGHVDDFVKRMTDRDKAYRDELDRAIKAEEQTWQGRNRAVNATDRKFPDRDFENKADLARLEAKLRSINLSKLTNEQLKQLRAWTQTARLDLDRLRMKPPPVGQVRPAGQGAILHLAAGQLSAFDNLIKARLPLLERISRPAIGGTGTRAVQKAYDEALRIALEMEKLGLRTNWSGSIIYGGAGRSAATFDRYGTMNVNANTFKYTDANRQKVLLHELLHGTSNLSGGKDVYSAAPGWEEGVVEGLAQAINRVTGAGTGYNTYNQYVTALDAIGGFLNYASREAYYIALIKTPLNLRSASVLDQINQLDEPAKSRALDVFRSADKTLSTRFK